MNYGAANLDFKFSDQPWFAVVLLERFHRERSSLKQTCLMPSVSTKETTHAAIRTESNTASMFHQ